MDLQVKKRQRPCYLLPPAAQNKKVKIKDAVLSKKVENTSRPIMQFLENTVSGTEHSDKLDFRWKKDIKFLSIIPVNKGNGKVTTEPFYLKIDCSSISSINLSSVSKFSLNVTLTKKDPVINLEFDKFDIAKDCKKDLEKNVIKIAVLRNVINYPSPNDICTKTNRVEENVKEYLKNECDLDVILNVDDKIYKFSVPIILMSISALQVAGKCYNLEIDKKEIFENLLSGLANKATGPILEDGQTSNHLEGFKIITTENKIDTESLKSPELSAVEQNVNFYNPYNPDLLPTSQFLCAPTPLFSNLVPWVPVFFPSPPAPVFSPPSSAPAFSPPPVPVLSFQNHENFMHNSETETVLMPKLNELNSMNELTQIFNSHELYRDIDLNSTDEPMESLTPELNRRNALCDQSMKEINSHGFYQDFDLNLTCEQMMDLF